MFHGRTWEVAECGEEADDEWGKGFSKDEERRLIAEQIYLKNIAARIQRSLASHRRMLLKVGFLSQKAACLGQLLCKLSTFGGADLV